LKQHRGLRGAERDPGVELAGAKWIENKESGRVGNRFRGGIGTDSFNHFSSDGDKGIEFVLMLVNSKIQKL
jgi:hypothetical protein